MEYRVLGNSSISVSVIGLGALHFGVFLNEKESADLINAAFDHGVQFIDTAPMYGSGESESIIGCALHGKRHQFVLGTKVGLSPIINQNGQFGVEKTPLSEKKITKSIEISLKALRTDYIDILQLHSYDNTVPIEETLFSLEKLKSSGKIRALGCSNYHKEEMISANEAIEKYQTSGFSSLQTHYNMLERRFESDLLPYCQQYNIGVLCYRALSRGILNHKYKAGEMIPKNTRAAVSARVRNLLNDKLLQLVQSLNDFSEQRAMTTGQLALAWLLNRPGVSSALIGARNTAQLLENIGATKYKLTDDDFQAIDKIIDKFDMLKKVQTDPSTFLET